MRSLARAGLSLLCLLAFAASASAECAWVLWWEDEYSSFSYRTADANVVGAKSESSDETRSWNILGAHPTNVACERAQAEKIASMLKRWQKEKAEAKFGEHTIAHQAGGNIISQRSQYVGERTTTSQRSIRYVCLPDTIDPRGPKGK